MFIDRVIVNIQAGKGGNGIIAFIKEKYMPKGGPGGGDGGDGGSIFFEADENISTLLHLRYRKQILGNNGTNGSNKKQHGKKGKDIIIKVPCGTIIKENKKIIFDLKEHQEKYLVAQGGKGGKGNARFASSRNPAPRICENGALGIQKNLEIELLILADVGLVGIPSVGKSTLISAISQAKPEIASYPFTTLTPKLGFVKVKNDSFVVADLPGQLFALK